MNIFSFLFKKKKVTAAREPILIKIIGSSANCINCGKPIGESHQSTGHTKKYTVEPVETVLSNFCNGYCLRDWRYKSNGENGTEWLEDYGVIQFDKPTEYYV